MVAAHPSIEIPLVGAILIGALLNEYAVTCMAVELMAIASDFMGCDFGQVKKAGIIKALHNWQREAVVSGGYSLVPE
jgi:hypothetical protein